ncbi:hypothetical protein [Amycolatopsis sp. NPDC004378]
MVDHPLPPALPTNLDVQVPALAATTAIKPSVPVLRETTARRAAVYLTLAMVSLINFISYASLDVRAHEKAWGDALNYYAMSEHTGAQVDNPFALRMLSPWLVHLAGKVTGLPLDVLWLGYTDVVTLACAVVFFLATPAYVGFRLWAQNLIGSSYGFGSGQGNKGPASNIVYALSSNKHSEHAALFDTFHSFWIIFGYGLYEQYRPTGRRRRPRASPWPGPGSCSSSGPPRRAR